ncbi:hypothetical protein ACX80Z_10065 [Arthrobacter sp. TMT4-20]
MCEIPKGPRRSLLTPKQLVLGCLSVTLVVAGILLPPDLSDEGLASLAIFGVGLYGFGLITVGTALLVTEVILPAVKEVEFGLPSGDRMATAVSSREEALRDEFDRQRGDLELCAQLLCDDPVIALRLLEAAWAKAAAVWKGPVTPDIRTFVICQLVDLVDLHLHNAGRIRAPSAGGSLLTALDGPERTAMVLRDFAGLSPTQIAVITNRSVDRVRADLRTGNAKADAQRETP